jgi:hypothetical protein
MGDKFLFMKDYERRLWYHNDTKKVHIKYIDVVGLILLVFLVLYLVGWKNPYIYFSVFLWFYQVFLPWAQFKLLVASSKFGDKWSTFFI